MTKDIFTIDHDELEKLFIKKHSKSRINGGLGELIAYDYLVRCLRLTPHRYPKLTGSSPQILEKIGMENEKISGQDDEKFWGKELHARARLF